MSRIAYVNGRYLPMNAATVHIEDRAHQFADGVYEVCAVAGGAIVDLEPHLVRLARSLGELRIPAPMDERALVQVMHEVVRRNRVGDGILYIQVSRGRAPRNHGFPKNAVPSVVMTARGGWSGDAPGLRDCVKVVSSPDIRWGRCDIKSVSLLPNVLAKQAASEAGAFETWLVDGDGYVTEGSSTNAWLVDGQGRLHTRAISPAILSGVTRLKLLELARTEGMTIVEEPFTVAMAQAAPEAFLTSTSNFVLPVLEIDGHMVGTGQAGPVTRKLQDIYRTYVRSHAEPGR
ncbi:MAG: D-amino acid aminotransferase [Rhodospirillaceae bacterium]|nr:D-amino acid aminotransferase [Rhodospirillaceae bacterium]